MRIFYFDIKISEHYSRLSLLDRAEQYTYQELLWRDGMGWPLPRNPERLAAVLDAPPESVNGVLDKLGWLFITEGEHLHHAEILEARAKAAKRSARAAESGRKGGLTTQTRRRDIVDGVASEDRAITQATALPSARASAPSDRLSEPFKRQLEHSVIGRSSALYKEDSGGNSPNLENARSVLPGTGASASQGVIEAPCTAPGSRGSDPAPGGMS